MPVDLNKNQRTRRALLGFGVVAICGAVPPTREKELAPARKEGLKKPPFELGRVQVIDPKDPTTANLPPPEITIFKPTKDEKLQFGKPLNVHVRLVLPEGGKLPTFVVVGVKRDGVYHGTRNANPQASILDLYTLEAVLKGLKGTAGDYEIEVEAIYVYMNKTEDGGLEEAKTTRYYQRVTRHFERVEES